MHAPDQRVSHSGAVGDDSGKAKNLSQASLIQALPIQP